MAERTRAELPYETYERITGKKWTSGKSADVTKLLSQYGIKAPAGSEQANNELQRALKRGLPEEPPAKPVAAKLLGAPVPSQSGLGIGLYQAARQAEQLGYRLELLENRNGAVCFQLTRATATTATADAAP